MVRPTIVPQVIQRMIPYLLLSVFITIQLPYVSSAHKVTTQNSTTNNNIYHRSQQQAISISLTLQEIASASTFATTGYPVSVVVPFAEGTLFDKDSLSISEGNPCQVEVLEKWLSDGSIRHAQVHFQASLTRRQRPTRTLINNGPSIKPMPTQPVYVNNTSFYVQVDTGKVRFQISKTSFNLFDQLWYDQNENGIYESTEQMIVSSAGNGGRFVPRAEAGGTQFDSSRDDRLVEVEEWGPLRAVVKVSAPTIFVSTTNHLHGFAVRIYAYAGQSFIKVDYQLQNSDSGVVKSWPLYFEEMSVDLKFQFPGGVTPQALIGSTTRQIVNATSFPASIQQTLHNKYTIQYGTTNVSETSTYDDVKFNAAFVHLQGGSTGVSVMMRNFWQSWPNGLAIDMNGKISIEMFPSWSAQFVNGSFTPSGLYWLNDMQHVYKEFMFTFHKSAPTTTRLLDTASTFQFPPVVSVNISWYQITKATFDMGGLLPPTLSPLGGTEEFTPDNYWTPDALDELSTKYKSNWVNFGHSVDSAYGCYDGFLKDIDSYLFTRYASEYYLVEIWSLGELNVRPQSLPSYSFNSDYSVLKLTDAGACPYGSWRMYTNGKNPYVDEFLPNTTDIGNMWNIPRPRFNRQFDHAALSYFYNGNYWMKDWYKFIGQFRRGYLTLQTQDHETEASYYVAHVIDHALEAFRIAGDTDFISDFTYFFRNYLRPRQDKLYGSAFGSDVTNYLSAEFADLMTTIINIMELVEKVDVQLYAELFNYLTGLAEWNLNTGNFAYEYNQYSSNATAPSYGGSLRMINPQAWYFWKTGRIEFWDHIELYMNGTLGDPPYEAPWSPNYPEYGVSGNAYKPKRMYSYVKQSMRQDITPPNPIVDLEGYFNSGKRVTLQWTGPATSVRYHLVWSDKPIVGSYSINATVINWWAASALSINKTATPGIKETLTIDIPYTQQPLYVAMFSFDEYNNLSKMSNAAQVRNPAPNSPVPLPSPPIVTPPTVTNPTPTVPVPVPLMLISPVPPIANPAPNAPVLVPFAPIVSPTKAPLPPPTVANPTTKAPTKAPLPSPTVANPTTKAPTKAPISPTMTPTVPIVSPPQAPLPKSKPPQLGPISPGNMIDIFPNEDFVGKLRDAGAGDTIIFHQGNYTTSSRIIISIVGTPSLPVIIRNAIGENRPRIQNTINIDGSTYLTIQGLEIASTGGDGVRITNVGRDTHDITLEDLIIHNISVGINAKTKLDMLHVNRTHIYDTSNSGEGIALGCEDGSCIVTNSIIEYNWIHNTALQGEGIEINKNSYGNIVQHNVVYNIQHHGILVYGSGSGTINTIEGNVMWNCTEAGIKVAADAIVQNNLVFNSAIGFESSEHNEVSPKNLRIVHNTILNINKLCLFMQSWNGKSDIIFANNAVYCMADTFQLDCGYQNVQLSGNVFYPTAVLFPESAFKKGRSLAQDIKDYANLNAYPVDVGQLRDNANPMYAVGIDFDGASRVNRPRIYVGAYQWTNTNARKWEVTEGFKPFLIPDVGPIGSTPVPTSAPIPSQSPPVTPTPKPCRLLRGCIFGRTFCFSSHNTVQILKRQNNSSSHDVMSYNDRTDSEIIMMSELKVGDYVRSSSSGQYTRVISFCHKDTKAVASFIQIHSMLLSYNKSCNDYSSPKYKIEWWNNTNRKGQDQQTNEIYGDNATYADVDDDLCGATESLPVLELSHDHMVYVFRHHQHHHHRNPTELTQNTERGWVRAVDVEIGDVLIHRLNDSDEVYYGVVTDTTTIQRNDGVYSPITATGSLYVSNTMVSSYVAVLQTPTVMSTSSDNNTPSSMLLLSSNMQHMIAHVTLTPIRLLCQYDFETYCQNEVYDDIDNGYAWYSRYILYYVEWLESLGTIRSPDMLPQWMFNSLIQTFQWTSTIVIMIPFLLLYFIEVNVSFIMNGYEAFYCDDSNNLNSDLSLFFTPQYYGALITIIIIIIMTVMVRRKRYGSPDSQAVLNSW